MNDVQNFIDRQLGIYSRLNYDNVIKRLMVHSEESFYGLQSGGVVDSYDQDPPIFACRFSEAPGYENILALANEDGRVAIQDISTPKTASKLESFQCHNNAVFDLAWIPGEMSFVTVSGDHSACLWDVGGGAVRRVGVFAAHSKSVKSVACAGEQRAVFATGGRDGHVLVWDARAPRPPALRLRPDDRLRAPHAAPAPRSPARRPPPRAASITGLAFGRAPALLSAAECDGLVKEWDLRKSYAQYTRAPLAARVFPYAGASARRGYSHLLVDAPRLRLYASCMDDVIYCFNLGAAAAPPERRFRAHLNATFYVKASLSADGRYLASGSSDKCAYVWSAASGELLARLAAHRAEVTCAAWAPPHAAALVTCGDDATHMIWRVGADPDDGDEPLARAQPAPPRAAASPPPRTPSAPKRPASTPPTAGKRARSDRTPPRRPKRCLIELLNASRDPDEVESEAKRARRDVTPPASPARDEWRPAAEAEGEAAAKRARLDALTAGLPDYVATGEAPHLRLMSPAKARPDTTDWLTQLRRARTAPAAPAPAPGAAPLSPGTRRCSTERPRPRTTLLKYFKVSARHD